MGKPYRIEYGGYAGCAKCKGNRPWRSARSMSVLSAGRSTAPYSLWKPISSGWSTWPSFSAWPFWFTRSGRTPAAGLCGWTCSWPSWAWPPSPTPLPTWTSSSAAPRFRNRWISSSVSWRSSCCWKSPGASSATPSPRSFWASCSTCISGIISRMSFPIKVMTSTGSSATCT